MTERLSHPGRHLGRTIGATLLGTGLLLTTHEQHANAFVDYGLPAFDHAWPDSEGGEVFAHMHFDQNSSGYFVADNGLPKPYMVALNTALSNPVVSAEIREGQVQDLTVRKGTSETRDNGQFDYRQSELKLFITSGHLPPEDRLYSDTRVLKAVVVHEGQHASSEKWYQYIRGDLPEVTPPAEIAAELKELQEAQDAVNDIFYSHLPEPCAVSPGEAQTDCTMEKLQRYADESFQCIDEGYALQELLGREQPLRIGHPDHTYEAAASVVTGLEMNPSYIPDCLDKSSSPLTMALRKLTKQILKITFKTSPAVEDALRRTQDRSDAIDRLIS